MPDHNKGGDTMTSNELSALFEALLALIDSGQIDKVKEILAKYINK